MSDTGSSEPLVSLVRLDNRDTRSTCPTSVFTGIGQTLMSRPVLYITQYFNNVNDPGVVLYKVCDFNA